MEEQKKISEVDFSLNYGILLQIPKSVLLTENVLDDYIEHRKGDKFDENGYDYITIFQAQLIGLIK